jgi:hypothetical protein
LAVSHRSDQCPFAKRPLILNSSRAATDLPGSANLKHGLTIVVGYPTNNRTRRRPNLARSNSQLPDLVFSLRSKGALAVARRVIVVPDGRRGRPRMRWPMLEPSSHRSSHRRLRRMDEERAPDRRRGVTPSQLTVRGLSIRTCTPGRRLSLGSGASRPSGPIERFPVPCATNDGTTTTLATQPSSDHPKTSPYAPDRGTDR